MPETSAPDDLGRRWLHALTRGSGEVVALFDARGRLRFVAVSRTAQRLLGHDATTIARQTDLEWLHPDDRPRVVEAFKLLAAQDGARHTLEYRVRHSAGHYVRVQSTALNHLADPVVRSMVVHTREASRNLVRHDGGDSSGRLRDKDGFLDRVGQAVERARGEADYGFSVLQVELERLKMLVGSYGQQVVDDVLGEATDRLLKVVGTSDAMSHLGGGEFAMLLDGVLHRRQAERIADRIQKALSMAYEVDGKSITTTAVVGIATSERVYERADDVLRDAALAATRAHARGRRRQAVFQTQMRLEDSHLLSLVAGLHGAVQGNQLRLHYQPIVAMEDQRLVGFEALVRWNRPREGVVSPAEFIPVAEETGLIAAIGQWVLTEACQQMARWVARFEIDPRSLYVGVNLSPKQLAEEELAVHVERALADNKLDPRQLKLEVTESAVLENRDTAMANIHRLKERGIEVSLDDFGTGYSSFSYLYQLPYDTLKIDRSFVARLGEAGEGREIVNAIVVLAHTLRMAVVAEGVETAAQASELTALGCEYGQGYHFSPPLEADAATELIATRKR
jgi:diguanylate cyclase (GGDEF)-like protein